MVLNRQYHRVPAADTRHDADAVTQYACFIKPYSHARVLVAAAEKRAHLLGRFEGVCVDGLDDVTEGNLRRQRVTVIDDRLTGGAVPTVHCQHIQPPSVCLPFNHVTC